MPSIFTRIVQGEIPSYKVYEDEHTLAFLDINPLAKGHTLVIPKKEVDYLFDVDDTLLQHLLPVCKHVAHGIEQVVPCERVGVAVVGLEVPHAHIHLIPINGVHDIDFSRPKLQFSSEEFDQIASTIRLAI